jgi:hypothetical protein
VSALGWWLGLCAADTNVTDAGCATIADLIKSMGSLDSISLLGWRHVTPAGWKIIVDMLRASPGSLRYFFGVNIRDVDTTLPREMATKENNEVLLYYNDLLQSGSVAKRRIRLMLCGNGGVGKTTLARTLAKVPSSVVTLTHGIECRECLRGGCLLALHAVKMRCRDAVLLVPIRVVEY